jgi:cell division septation protein DedD
MTLCPRLSLPFAIVLLILNTAAARSVTADPLIAHAQRMARSGDNESASRLYRSWLELNADCPGSATVFSRYFRLETDVPALLDASEHFLSYSTGSSIVGEQFLRIARLLELAGRTEAARDAYLKAYAATGSEAALLSCALLSLEMNDIDSLVKSRESLNGKSGQFDSLVSALISLQSGDDVTARSALLSLADNETKKDISLRVLWIVFSSAQASGDQKALAEARKRMSSGFPESPETVLASAGTSAERGGASVVALPRPDLPAVGALPGSAASAAAAQPVEPLTAPPDPAVAPQPVATRMAVQVGAFQVRENADDLVTNLLKIGFRPSVREESIQGVVHYRVFAGTAMDPDQASQLLSKLVQAGFSGFLVVEK